MSSSRGPGQLSFFEGAVCSWLSYNGILATGRASFPCGYQKAQDQICVSTSGLGLD